ncbi:PTS glucitol/sorbitol transporter subunit IIB [Vallicoccus soli]|uniref:PTS sorbitol transporter subunit IIB n=1 Tax=Vallicoccus soli TaxID=2339232 RepID=A0A3A3ZJ04_9ACTN|nr:PTS glucitol/sorbitol transporter subunit IIB [Vallicoccus soli]RJK95472.1 PTS sorbitol transporter subunit IIB [Vallicoccus soli]
MTSVQQQDTPRAYRSVEVRPGRGGWGRGLVLTPDGTRDKVISVTGGGIHPVAARIGELTGAQVVDGFRTSVPDEQVLVAVINCGGTARIGVYPKKRIPTVDVYPGEPGGPLAQFITEDVFVSAVTPADVHPVDAAVGAAAGAPAPGPAAAAPSAVGPGSPTVPTTRTPEPVERPGFFVRFGGVIGYIINTFLSAGRQSIQLVLNTVLPFMAYVSLLLGFVTYTGVAEQLGEWLRPLSSNPLGLVAIGVVVALPFLSPILGPGAAVAQIVGVLMGTQIGNGTLPVQYALPTLFAIDGQVGCDFIPVGLGLGEARPETVEVGTPAVLFSRLITSPLAVVIAYFASFGL